jgi:hypothetical protein
MLRDEELAGTPADRNISGGRTHRRPSLGHHRVEASIRKRLPVESGGQELSCPLVEPYGEDF